jgi:hypothetical protein
LTSPVVITPGWHTFANEWDTSGVTFYYDGESIGKIPATDSNQPQYLVLNNTLDKSWLPIMAPATVKCSYIRVWQAS